MQNNCMEKFFFFRLPILRKCIEHSTLIFLTSLRDVALTQSKYKSEHNMKTFCNNIDMRYILGHLLLNNFIFKNKNSFFSISILEISFYEALSDIYCFIALVKTGMLKEEVIVRIIWFHHCVCIRHQCLAE